MQEKQTIWTRNYICMLLANFLMQMSNFSSNTLAASYATFLGAAPTLMGFLTGMFYGISLLMRPVAGPVQTRVNHRRLLILVYAVGCLVNVGYALFHSIPAYLAFRVLHGIQYAFVGSLCMTMTANSLPREKLTSGLAIFGVSSSVAQAIAPSIGIWLCDWGTALRGEDFGYTVLFLFSVLVLALSLIPATMFRDTEHAGTGAPAAAGGKWYQNIASRHALPPALIMMLTMLAYNLYASYMVPFGTEFQIKNVGVFFTLYAAAILATRLFSGALSDRFGLHRMLVPGLVLFGVSFLLVGNAAGLPLILAGAVIGALGNGTSGPILQALVVQTEPRPRRAVASNTMFLCIDIGSFLGPVIGGLILSASGSYRTVLMSGGIPVVLALAVFLLTWPRCRSRIAEVQAIDDAEQAEIQK